MVRETRHLWIGSLPENVREDEIRDLFQRHGRVQSVKLLEEPLPNPGGNPSCRPGKSATVAFIDIRSASKALRNVRTVAGQPVHVSYYEPGSALPSPSTGPHNNNHAETSSNPSEGGSVNVNAPPQGSTNTNNVTGNNNLVAPNNCIPNSQGPGGMYRQRFAGQHGQSEDNSSHFYDQHKSFSRGRGDSHGFHGRGRRENRPPFHNRHSFPAENRNYRSQWNYHHEGRYAPPIHSEAEERPPVPSPVVHTPPSEPSSKPQRRPESPANSVSSRHLNTGRRRKSRSVSDSGSSGRGSSGGSRSRSGSRSSVSTSVSSSRSRSPSHHGHFSRGGGGGSSGDRFHHGSRSRHRYSRSRVLSRGSDSRNRHNSRSPLAASPSSSTSSSPSPHRKISAPHSPPHSPSSSKSYSPSRNAGGSQHHNNNHHRRTPNSSELHAAIKIRNLPIRSSDTSLKDGLYHEYKKHGKVAWVRVHGTGQERYAIVCFKSAEHATRAVSVSQGKLFFGCKIQVAPYNHAKGEDNVGGQDEENRLLEEEPNPGVAVGYPTRTVLITGLDASVTSTELQSTFEQYGDIVRVDIRKQGAATHAVCEFVDIASAIRAQWGRHVFKSKEARTSFYRNPPTTSLLLDGTAGVSEKQMYGQCCQYGAIKEIVMDPERVLALVQFQEISEAQTAIRQLRSWVIKGKRLQVDFASNDVIRTFLQRVSGVVTSPHCSSPGIISSPSIGNSIIPLQDTANINRRVPPPKVPLSDDGEMESVKTGRSERLRQITAIAGEGTVAADSRRQEFGGVYTSPVSPDGDQQGSTSKSQNDSALCTSTTKVDLSCHETDSAVVTSSSDIVVGEKCDTASSVGLSYEGKLDSVEPEEARGSRDVAIAFVDGVSSTSPEPKSEITRKASPDSVLDPLTTEDGKLKDPRKQPSGSKVRRSSADSGNSVGAVSDITEMSIPHPLDSTAESLMNDSESDNRPGTPLFDENPENYAALDVIESSKSIGLTPSSNKQDAISLPLPQFARDNNSNRQRSESNASSKETPSSSSTRTGRISTDSELKTSPKSPKPDNDFGVTEPHNSSESASVDKDTSEEGGFDQDMIGSPDSDTSPRNSPSSVSLQQRILKCCETYDRVCVNIGGSSPATSSKSADCVMESPSTRFKLFDWDELTRPSEIGRSVLARKSVFDEDSKRLENFEEKYEAKGLSGPSLTTNWRAIALQRSLSVSASSSNSVPWTSSHLQSLNHPMTPTLPSTPSRVMAAPYLCSGLTGVLPNPALQSVSPVTINKPSPSVFHRPHDLSTPCVVPAVEPRKPESSPIPPPHPLKTRISPPPSLPPIIPSGPSLPIYNTGSHVLSNKLIPLKSCTEVPKSPSYRPTESKPAKDRTLNPPSIPIPPTASSRENISPENDKSILPSDVPPRPVERSLSLDSNNKTATNSLTPVPFISLPADKDNVNPTKSNSRRTSIDVQPVIPSPKSESGHSSVSNKSEYEVHNHHHGTLPVKAGKEVVHEKTDLVDLVKTDMRSIKPVQQQTTVAIVAADQMTYIPSRTDSAGSTTNKEASRKDKDKKRRSSGSSTPISSLPPSNLSNTLTRVVEPPTTSNCNLSGLSSGKKSEEKEKKDKKENKEPKHGTLDSGHSADVKTEKDEGNTKRSQDKEKSDKKDKNKEVKKDKKESHASSSSHGDSHTHHQHRRDKDSSSKRKRESSGNDVENDSEPKKPKSEKEPQEGLHTHHHKVKAAATTERRESISTVSKEVHKAKEHKESGPSRTSSSGHSESHASKEKTKEHSKAKDGQHSRTRDKEKSTSSTSKDVKSSSSEKGKVSSESRSSHHGSKSESSSHKDKEKDRPKKERTSSPGKENVKSTSKHHSHSSSSSHRSSNKSKESTSTSTSSSKTQDHETTKRTSHSDKHISVDSDSGSEIPHKAGNDEHGGRSSKSSKSKSSSSHSSKRDEKRERHKSDESTNKDGSDKKKSREKKKKRFVVDESDSSESDEAKKHHSIFEVVVDEYVSMYDKVKARSNRACKSQATPQDDVKKQQDKIKDQFRQLKQSRAKKVDKKRSTSVDDEGNKSGIQSSSDDDESGGHPNFSKSLDTKREHNFTQSSDDEEHKDKERSRSKLAKKMKEKKRSSGEKQMKKRGRKSTKSPPPKGQRSIDSVFYHSDSASNGSSTHLEPQRKKPKLGSLKLSSVETVQKMQDYKSSEESLSDSEDSQPPPKRIVEMSQKVDNSKALNKLQAADVYSESDSSVLSGPVSRLQLNSSKALKSKDKANKQKSIKKTLFSSSDSSSSEDERPVIENRKPKESSSVTSKPKDSNKTVRSKQHRVHSSNKSKPLRTKSGDGQVDTGSRSIRKEPPSAMTDMLFGPMSESSGSEGPDEPKDIKTTAEQLINKTPPSFVNIEKKVSDMPSPKKTKPSTNTDTRKYSRSISPPSSADSASRDKQKHSVSNSSEKKKKRHHKEKKSKKGDHEEQQLKPMKSTIVEPSRPDFDSLFNSPRVSPCKEEGLIIQPLPSKLREKRDSTSSSGRSYLAAENRSMSASPVKHIFEASTTLPNESAKSMFSSDEDDDDDRLKIDINEAIIASSDEPGVEEAEIMATEQRKREEEEKKLHSLFEQDKAIESIVHLDGKSPPIPPCNPSAEEEPAKDDLPKEPAISQEETEDAVAALLETLEGDDGMDDVSGVKPTVTPAVPSPPTLRIIEDVSSVSSLLSPHLGKNADKNDNSLLHHPEAAIMGASSVHSRKSSVDSRVGGSFEDVPGTLRRSSGSTKSSERDNDDAEKASADVYDFHDSDDDSSTKIKTSKHAAAESTTKSPLTSPNLPATSLEPKSGIIPPTGVSVVVSSHTVPPTPVSCLPILTVPQISPSTLVVPKPSPPAGLIPTSEPVAPPAPKSKTPPTVYPRSNVDDTIEAVIRMAVSDSAFGLASPPPSSVTITSVKAGSRGRSKSKDSVTEENTAASITRVTRSEVSTPSVPVPHGHLHTHAHEDTATLKEENNSTTETLIDPQTGILIPMIRQSDEGQYVPMVGQESGGLPKVQQPQFTVPCFGQTKSESPQERQQEKEALEAKPSQMPHQQKEGLAATLYAHPQVYQLPNQTQYIIPQTSAPGGKLILVPPKVSSVPTSTIRHSSPDNAVNFTGQPMQYPPHLMTNNRGHAGIHPDVAVLGPGPMIRAVYPPPLGLPPGQYQYAMISKAGEAPTIQQQTQAKLITTQQPVVSQHFLPAKYTPTSAAQDVKSFQIPSATTITKVNTSQEELQRKSGPSQSQASAVILSSPVVSVAGGSKGFLPSPSGMTHQQQQQHQAQTELFRKTAEGGLIRMVPKEDHLHAVKNQDFMQPPRIDISTSIAQQTAIPSPKSRIFLEQQYLPAAGRLPQYTLGHESGEVRIVSTPNPLSIEHPAYAPKRDYPLYATASSSPPVPSHGGRPIIGIPDGIDFSKHSPIPPHERRGIGAVPQPLSHLSSPHAIEQRNSESPVALAHLKASQHHYGAPSPAHQPTFKMMSEERHANSPNYAPAYDPRTAVALERERVMSPYASRPPYSPPPAHGRYSVPPQSTDSPTERRIVSGSGSPHQNQGDSLLMLLQRYPIMWQGMLALKNDNAACQMHFVSGNLNVARDSLPTNPDGSVPPLRISQRMRLEQTQLEGVARKIQMEPEHCMLLALPCGRDHMDVLQQSNNLRSGFITYLQLKQAAGIVNVYPPDSQHTSHVIHIFPSCDFANENLARIAPDLLHGVADIAHLLIVVATV